MCSANPSKVRLKQGRGRCWWWWYDQCKFAFIIGVRRRHPFWQRKWITLFSDASILSPPPVWRETLDSNGVNMTTRLMNPMTLAENQITPVQRYYFPQFMGLNDFNQNALDSKRCPEPSPDKNSDFRPMYFPWNLTRNIKKSTLRLLQSCRKATFLSGQIISTATDWFRRIAKPKTLPSRSNQFSSTATTTVSKYIHAYWKPLSLSTLGGSS